MKEARLLSSATAGSPVHPGPLDHSLDRFSAIEQKMSACLNEIQDLMIKSSVQSMCLSKRVQKPNVSKNMSKNKDMIHLIQVSKKQSISLNYKLNICSRTECSEAKKKKEYDYICPYTWIIIYFLSRKHKTLFISPFLFQKVKGQRIL